MVVDKVMRNLKFSFIDAIEGSLSFPLIVLSFLHFSFADNLYFINVDSDRTHVEVCQLDGKHRKILLSTKTETPTSLAVDPIGRYIFWADQGQKPSIQVTIVLTPLHYDRFMDYGLQPCGCDNIKCHYI